MRLSLIFLCLLLCACSGSKKKTRKVFCYYDGAFELGSNDAQDGARMRGEGLSEECPDNVKADVRKGYRDGYTTSKESRPNGVYVDENVKADRIRRNFMTRSCIESFGKKICGYGCIESYGKAKCARHSGNNCVDEFGKIVCGFNCREDSGRVVCEERE